MKGKNFKRTRVMAIAYIIFILVFTALYAGVVFLYNWSGKFNERRYPTYHKRNKKILTVYICTPIRAKGGYTYSEVVFQRNDEGKYELYRKEEDKKVKIFCILVGILIMLAAVIYWIVQGAPIWAFLTIPLFAAYWGFWFWFTDYYEHRRARAYIAEKKLEK